MEDGVTHLVFVAIGLALTAALLNMLGILDSSLLNMGRELETQTNAYERRQEYYKYHAVQGQDLNYYDVVQSVLWYGDLLDQTIKLQGGGSHDITAAGKDQVQDKDDVMAILDRSSAGKAAVYQPTLVYDDVQSDWLVGILYTEITV